MTPTTTSFGKVLHGLMKDEEKDNPVEQPHVDDNDTLDQVPHEHWCGHYLDPVTRNVIPDGATCCWRHWIGLPRRWGQRHPYYPWQEEILAAYGKHNYMWILKPPKIGATELFLGLAMHEACVNPEWLYGQVAFVVGTSGMAEAEHMISRCKETIELKDAQGRGTGQYRLPIHESYNNKRQFYLNTVEFRAHPADNVDSIRSQPNMRMIIVDEGAFFSQTDQQTVRDAFEHYVGGSNTKIILVSTAGDSPSGFMFDIGQEPDALSGGVYRHFHIPYEVGLKSHSESGTTLYKQEQIEKAKTLPSFARNYLGKWGHGEGNIFPYDLLQKCIEEYDLQLKDGYKALMADPAYGSSKSQFGLLGYEVLDGVLYVKLAEQYQRPSPMAMTNKIQELAPNYDNTVGVDAAHPGLILDLQELGVSAEKIMFSNMLNEMTDYAA